MDKDLARQTDLPDRIPGGDPSKPEQVNDHTVELKVIKGGLASTAVEQTEAEDNNQGSSMESQSIEELARNEKVIQLIFDLQNYRETSLECNSSDDASIIHNARINHAQTYYRAGYLKPNAIDGDGYLIKEIDPNFDRARYFGVVDMEQEGSELLASARKILTNGRGKKDLPSYKKLRDKMAPRYVEQLEKLQDEEVVEISALGKIEGAPLFSTIALYREMIHDSIKRGEKMWFMGVVPQTRDLLIQQFGTRIIKIAGEEVELDSEFVAEDVTITPVIINIETLFEDLEKEVEAEDNLGRKLFLELLHKYITDLE